MWMGIGGCGTFAALVESFSPQGGSWFVFVVCVCVSLGSSVSSLSLLGSCVARGHSKRSIMVFAASKSSGYLASQ